MFTTKDILTICISSGIPIFMWWLTLPKQKAEIASYFSNMYKGLIDELRATLDIHKKEIEANKQEISNQRKVNEDQQRENEECKLTSATLKLQVKRLNRIVDLHGYEWEKVYVLDDNPLVTMAFEHHFKEAHIEMAVFNNADLFVRDVKEHGPCVLIIDHWLGEVAADEIINQVRTGPKRPEIILMSQDKSVGEKFKDMDIKFFPKTENYVMKIALAVIDFLKDKN